MKRNFITLAKILILYIFISSCAETVEVTTSFQEIVPIAGNLTFTFEENVVPQEKVNIWDTTQYIIFEPEIKGKFKWVNRNKLIFSPYNYLTPATDFEANINKKIFRNFDEKIDIDPIEFHTPYLELQNISSYWTTDETNLYQPYIVADLSYTYRVNPTDIKDFILVTVNGTEKEFKLLKNDVSQIVSIYITDIETDTEEEFTISISSNQGLPAYDIETTQRVDQSFEAVLQSPKTFEVTNSFGQHDGFSGSIYVETSQEVKEENLENFITVFPSVDFTVENNGQSIVVSSSQFDIDKEYTITLKENITGVLGGILKYSYTNSIKFGELDAIIKFVDKKSTYMSAKGEKNMQLYLVNVPEAHIKITKVYENNILSYLGTGYYYYDYYYDIYDYDWSSGDDEPGSLGDVVYEEDIITKNLEVNGNFRLLNLDFKDKIADYEGLYVVEVSSKDDYWLNKRKVVSISDIGLIVKKGIKSITVFANSISTAKAIPNVKIKFFGKNNQELSSQFTDSSGVAIYKIDDLPAENFDALMVTATYNNDFNYLHFKRSEIDNSNYDISGATQNLSGYDAFIYPERDIYRPDETIHLSAILRDYEWKTPSAIPLVLKIVSPNGKIYKTIKKTLNSYGSFEAEVYVPADALTGTYYAELYTSNEVFLTSQSILVEEFMPDRIKVEVELNSEIQQLNDSATLSITATNLFGPPAKDRNYEVERSLYLKYFYPDNYSDYNFDISERMSYLNSIQRGGITDENGKAVETFEKENSLSDMGIIRATYFVTVFDENGRSVNKSAYADIYTQDVFYGIKYPDYYNNTKKAMTFNLIALDKDYKTLSGKEAKVIIIKHEYNTVLAQDGSYYRYKSEHKEVILKEEIIKINGENTIYTFTPETSGEYEIRLSKPEIATYVKCGFYAYGYGSTTTTSFEVNSDGKIDIELDLENYKVGETANVLLKTPFSGKILVTVENDNVLDYFYVETDKKSATFKLPIKAEYIPNVYITATLFRAHTVSELPIMTAHGFLPVVVENTDNKLSLSIIAETNSKSDVTQTIKIKSKPNSAVTIAVVDEGILQLTGFETPDPYEFFYRKRALNVFSYDVYPYLFPEIIASSSLKGGDGNLDLSKRINPLTNKRVKLVSFWSGILETDAYGNASFDIAIPQFSGSLRIMAVAYKDKKFASASATMTVANDIVVSTGLPRFLSPGDIIEVPVTLTNTTEKLAICNALIKIEGPLTLVGLPTSSVTIAANDEGKLVYKIKAKNEIGEAKVTVSVIALGTIFKEELDITVRPASSLLKIFGSGSIPAGSNQTITMGIDTYIPESIDKKLIISTLPLIQFTKDLDYLITYPYGCVEQTVSSAFPQLYYPELSKIILEKEVNSETTDFNINEAIRKIKLMQLYNGGLTYWAGGSTESWWGTAYAAHFLIEAKKAGYEVDETTLNLMLAYLKNQLKDKSTITYYYNYAEIKQIVPKAAIYSLFVLSLAETPDKSSMNYYKSNRDLLSLDSKYLLAASYALNGDSESYNEIIPTGFDGEVSTPVFGGDFYSPIRDEAIALYSLLIVDPTNQQIGIMAKHLSETVAVTKYMSTQECVFTFLAMSKIAKMAEASDIKASIKVDGVEIANFDNSTVTLNTDDFAGGNLEITTSGTGTLYYFWDAEGISADGSYIEEDRNIEVRKYFYDNLGNQIKNNKFKQSDLILVRISIIGLTDLSIDNVVITDILPAGFEIENARLVQVQNVVIPTSKTYPEYLDIRDDRISFFTNVNSTERNFYYLVRAVTKGTFKMGPVGADAMYNGEFHSYNGGGEIIIEE